jgi:hypothetical protein
LQIFDWRFSISETRPFAPPASVQSKISKSKISLVTPTGLEQSAEAPVKRENSKKRAVESGAILRDSTPAGRLSQANLPPDVADLARRLAALPEADRRALAKALGVK